MSISLKRRTFTVPARNGELREIPTSESCWLSPDDPDIMQPTIEFTLPDGRSGWIFGHLPKGQESITIKLSRLGNGYRVIV